MGATIQSQKIPLRHAALAALFVFLALNAVVLIYVMVDAKRLSALLETSKLGQILDQAESRQAAAVPAPTVVALAPAPSASGAARVEPQPSAASAASIDATELAETSLPQGASEAQEAERALTMSSVAAISTTGACVALESFRSDIQIQSAKALLASSPLRAKSWMVSTAIPASYLAGIEADNAAGARRLAKALAERGLEPLSMSARFVGLAKSDTASGAIELATATAAGIPNARVSSRLLSGPTERRTIVALPQTRLEKQFASTLAARLPGVTLAPVPCPAAAAELLSAK